MPSLNTYKKMLGNRGNTIGQVHKYESDLVMEETFERDPQTRLCYLYDVDLDDSPSLNYGMTYENTTKIPVLAKFITTAYQSLDKDMVEHHLMFKPSFKNSEFTETDEMYFYQKRFTEMYGARYFSGLYVDIPNDRGIYERWIIIEMETAIQFPKYLVLPCNYRYNWVAYQDGKRVLRRMWGTSRMQRSYNSGVYRKYQTEYIENQDKCWFPMNPITDEIYYTDDEGHNVRMIISVPTKHPTVWRVTKVENHSPVGIQMITMAQDNFNPSTDFIDWDAINKGDIYALYADYYDNYIPPEKTEENEINPTSNVICKISASNSQIKAGGSYKTLTARFIDSNGDDITDFYANYLTPSSWSVAFEDDDLGDATEFVTWRGTDEINEMKLKFANNKKYLTKILIVRCMANGVVGELRLEIINL